MTGLELDFQKHCRVEFREYVQTHAQQDNSTEDRKIGSLALHPTVNEEIGNYFKAYLQDVSSIEENGPPSYA